MTQRPLPEVPKEKEKEKGEGQVQVLLPQVVEVQISKQIILLLQIK